MEADSYNNWNRSFVRVYDDAKRDSDVVLLTGDLIDYGRGHWGVQARDRLGDDKYYHADRNWFLFYYLLASRDAYKQPSYTILGNHDWRFNPYPPLIKGASPTPDTLIKTTNSSRRKSNGTSYARRTARAMIANSPTI
jgi:3',5'-cyclic AMP phosphodiesterase CpdA